VEIQSAVLPAGKVLVSDDSKPTRPSEAGDFFGMAYTAIVRDRTLPRNVRTLYAYFTTYCTGDDRVAFPGRDLIAEDVDLSVRAVNDAIRVGERAGLWSVSKFRSTKGYDRNRYHLHDTDGGYRPGTGPGARAKGLPRGCTTEPQAKSASGHRQKQQEPQAKSADEIDTGVRPTGRYTPSTSSETACRGREQVRTPDEDRKPRLYVKPNLDAMKPAGVRGHLVAAILTALRAVNLEPHPTLAGHVGRWVKERQRAGGSNADIVQALREALADPHRSGFVAVADMPPTTEPAHPAAHLDPDGDDYIEELEDLCESDAGGLSTYSRRMLDGMVSAGEHPIAIYNAVLKCEREGSDPW
jgi:hypothetical protein